MAKTHTKHGQRVPVCTANAPCELRVEPPLNIQVEAACVCVSCQLISSQRSYRFHIQPGADCVRVLQHQCSSQSHRGGSQHLLSRIRIIISPRWRSWSLTAGQDSEQLNDSEDFHNNDLIRWVGTADRIDACICLNCKNRSTLILSPASKKYIWM